MKHRGGMRVIGKRSIGSLAGRGREGGREGGRERGQEGRWGQREWEGPMESRRTS